MIYTLKADMVKYFSARINGRKALMIDLQGSGMHFCKLQENSNLKFQIFMCHRADSNSIKRFYEGVKKIPLPENWIKFAEVENKPVAEDMNFSLLDSTATDLIELFNRATHNTPIKLNTVKIGEEIIPDVIFSEVSDTENLDVFETCLQEVLKSNIVWWSGKTPQETVETTKKIVEIFETLAGPITLKNSHNLTGDVDRVFLYNAN